MSCVTTATDPKTCPMCESPLVPTSRQDRQCNACGFACTVHTPDDEQDAAADRQARSRAHAEQHGRGHRIERGQTRW